MSFVHPSRELPKHSLRPSVPKSSSFAQAANMILPAAVFGHSSSDPSKTAACPCDPQGPLRRPSRLVRGTRSAFAGANAKRKRPLQAPAQPCASPASLPPAKPHLDVLTVPVSIPPEYARLKYSCSAYNTYNFQNRSRGLNPNARLRPAADTCPRLSPFPWQEQSDTLTQLRPKSRHVEIVIPDWARPVARPPSLTQLPALVAPPSTPASATPSRPPSPPETPASLASAISFSNFPTPPFETAKPSIPPRLSSLRRRVPVEKPQLRTKALRQALYTDYYLNKPLPPINSTQPLTPPSSKASSPFRCPAPKMATDVLSPATAASPNTPTSGSAAGANSLSGLMCNVHRTTGSKPPALVGASTTVSGDKLFVFGGRRLSRRRTQLTSDMYELDLISRHWTKLSTKGTLPAPRYFHTVCALGDTKLVCYGGMASASHAPDGGKGADTHQGEPGIVVMSDVHFYDIASASWTLISTPYSPPGRYAHCAAILPSYSVFTSESAPLSALRPAPGASPSSQNMVIDGKGGAEMVVVGGQDGASQYIEQISVFNLRSLTWTTTTDFGKSCGAYRSVVAPMTTLKASQVGAWAGGREPLEQDDDDDTPDGHTTLIYSNYNFMDVKLELELRLPDGSVVEKPMKGAYTPPGLRFPHGEVINNHFLVSGTLITSNRQEYALWALDLRTLQWTRIDAGPGILNTGSWNRGLLWKKRSQFIVLGDRRRKLDEDYNHRRLNFGNICSIELEAFGLYDNPVTTPPGIGFASASCPVGNLPDLPVLDKPAPSDTAQNLGRTAAEMREIADMDFLAHGGERISVNFHLVARRWGPYLTQLLDGATKRPAANGGRHEDEDDEERRNTVLANDHLSRNSSITITPGSVTSFSNTISSALDSIGTDPKSLGVGIGPSESSTTTAPISANMDYAATPTLAPANRSRVLFLPHTAMTIRALVYYLYTWSLPEHGTPLCTPQILCSLLQIARPYRVNGLLEATVERLHQSFDGKSTAAIFNAAAMAAGGGEAIAFANAGADRGPSNPSAARGPSRPHVALQKRKESAPDAVTDSEDDGGSASQSSSATSLASLDGGSAHADGVGEIWTGELSSVVGLQKRGLRGLMEGRAMRDRMMGEEKADGGRGGGGGANAGAPAVGLGIGA